MTDSTTSSPSYTLFAGSQQSCISKYTIASITGQITNMENFPLPPNPKQIPALTSPPHPLSISSIPVAVISGSLTNTISLHSATGSVLQELTGHTGGVISFSWLPHPTDNILLSGSWDGTCKIWNLSNMDFTNCSPVQSLDGHENGVSVVGLNPTTIITGSTGKKGEVGIIDQKLRVWLLSESESKSESDSTSSSSFELVVENSDHLGPIRCLCSTSSGAYFLSGSNDATVVQREGMTAMSLLEMRYPPCEADTPSSNSDPFVLSVDTFDISKSSGNVKQNVNVNANVNVNVPPMHVSGAEDGRVCVWDGTTGACLQTIHHPTCVWVVRCLPNGDIATGCQDGKIRVFTRVESRLCEEKEKVDFDQEVSASCERSELRRSELRRSELVATSCNWCEDFDSPTNPTNPTNATNATNATNPTNPTNPLSLALAQVKDAIKVKQTGPTKEDIAKLPLWEECGLPKNAGKSDMAVKVFNKNGKAVAGQWQSASGLWCEIGEVTGSNENRGTIDGVEYDFVFPIEIEVAGGGVQTLRIGHNSASNPFVSAQAFLDKHELDQNYLGQIADYILQRVGDDGSDKMIDMTGDPNSNSNRAAPAPQPQVGVHLKNIPMRTPYIFNKGHATLPKILTKLIALSSPTQQPVSDADNNHLNSLVTTLMNTSHFHSTKISVQEVAAVGRGKRAERRSGGGGKTRVRAT